MKGTNAAGSAALILSLIVLSSGCLDGGPDVNLIQTGSSTILPLATIWAEEFDVANVAVSAGGSSHGLEALLKGEADLGDASRLMKGSDYEVVGGSASDVLSDGTAVRAAPTGVWPYKWVVAYDVLAVIVNEDNTWTPRLNYSQLRVIFTDDNPADRWDDPRLGLTGAPHDRIEIYGPDEGSGTYDYFFESIIKDWKKPGQAQKSRLESGDGFYHPSSDDNVILSAVKDNENAIGYIGFAYLVENEGAVRSVQIAKTTGYVAPSFENVGSYPMSRPLHIYTNGKPSLSDEKTAAIRSYIEFVLSDEGQELVPFVGFVKLDLVNATLRSDQLNALGG